MFLRGLFDFKDLAQSIFGMDEKKSGKRNTISFVLSLAPVSWIVLKYIRVLMKIRKPRIWWNHVISFYILCYPNKFIISIFVAFCMCIDIQTAWCVIDTMNNHYCLLKIIKKTLNLSTNHAHSHLDWPNQLHFVLLFWFHQQVECFVHP